MKIAYKLLYLQPGLLVWQFPPQYIPFSSFFHSYIILYIQFIPNQTISHITKTHPHQVLNLGPRVSRFHLRRAPLHKVLIFRFGKGFILLTQIPFYLNSNISQRGGDRMDDCKMTQGSQPFQFIYFPNKENPSFITMHILCPSCLSPSHRRLLSQPLISQKGGHVPKIGVYSPLFVGIRSTSIRPFLPTTSMSSLLIVRFFQQNISLSQYPLWSCTKTILSGKPVKVPLALYKSRL